MGDTLFAVHLLINLSRVFIGYALITVSPLYASDDWWEVNRGGIYLIDIDSNWLIIHKISRF